MLARVSALKELVTRTLVVSESYVE